MLRELHVICALCQGRAYPRQCRNSAAFREAQHAPDVCPYGIARNNLPIGDNLPPQAAGIFRGRDACAHLQVIPIAGCCDNDYRCLLDGSHLIDPATCPTCPDRAPALAQAVSAM